MPRQSFIPRRAFLMQAAGAFAARAAETQRKVRIAVIGVGGRGTAVLRTSLAMRWAEVAALCDIKPEAANRGVDLVQTHGGAKPALYTAGPVDYRRMLERDDFEAVFITGPAVLHGPMAVDSLRANKWVFSEVPASHSIEEGWALVRAAESTNAGYFLAENYCFSRNNLMILRMVEEGAFGTPTFAECGYLHNTRDLQFNADGSLTWRGEENSDPALRGNTYPTHSIGPVAQALGINRGDRFTTCVSMMTPPNGFHLYAEKRFGAGSAPAKINTWNGDNSLTLIRTESGAVVYLRFDNQSPRPHRMGFYTLQGTKGSADDERGVYFDYQSKGWEPFDQHSAQYDHPYWVRNAEKAKGTGHSGGDYFTLQHFYRCVREKRQPGIDVYDAVTWSAFTPLSAASIRQGSAPQAVPDYTSGKWKTRKRFDWANYG
jgi:predicted dehydrogenase